MKEDYYGIAGKWDIGLFSCCYEIQCVIIFAFMKTDEKNNLLNSNL